jgi:hypothetical protein
MFLHDSNVDKLNCLLATVREQGGRVLISYDDEDHVWMIGMEWGREAPDSNMAGAAAYGLQDKFEDALNQVVGEAGLSVKKP